jgi:hypothetical protein
MLRAVGWGGGVADGLFAGTYLLCGSDWKWGPWAGRQREAEAEAEVEVEVEVENR